MTINSKKKGNTGENAFANWLVNEGICHAGRNRGSGGGVRKSDVFNSIGINFEVK